MIYIHLIRTWPLDRSVVKLTTRRYLSSKVMGFVYQIERLYQIAYDKAGKSQLLVCLTIFIFLRDDLFTIIVCSVR